MLQPAPSAPAFLFREGAEDGLYTMAARCAAGVAWGTVPPTPHLLVGTYRRGAAGVACGQEYRVIA